MKQPRLGDLAQTFERVLMQLLLVVIIAFKLITIILLVPMLSLQLFVRIVSNYPVVPTAMYMSD